ncbi:MAG: UvrD-helicase domain-containing protein [Prevotellaceae bacterium]|jgi:DNA helicase-2/ATP-dependent DNA helicase PcrA|nr:UvrD-helicase domain-containing protein [Prevotellaceae bacterium]
MDFLNDLNPEQRAAVLCNDVPALVIAGAGSGKTRMLTYKIAYLLSQGVPPYAILALTFTNKAAREMKERIASLVDIHTTRRLAMGTFHSVFSRILRSEAEKIGFTSNFTIYDSADSRSLIKTIIKEMMLDDKQYKPQNVAARISSAKNKLISAQMYMQNAELLHADVRSRMPMVKDIYQIYAARCRQADAMDFDDLLFYTNVLFSQNPEVLEKYRRIFQYILVDEYQDTNYAQYRIIQQLAERHHRVCVVGDDAQSIYSFRGADIGNILHFKNQYPECKTFKLEQNYRSTQNIVNAANSLIQKNKNQLHKNVFSEKSEGAPITVLSTFSDMEESFLVSNQIAEMKRQGGYEYSDFAVLYRTNAQSRVFEESLRKRNIPYKIYGGLSFYQRKEIKDVIAYLRLSLNKNDEEAFRRIVNYPTRGIGATTVAKVEDCARTQGIPAMDVMGNPLAFNLEVNAGTAKKLIAFSTMMGEFSQMAQTEDAYKAADKIIRQSGISEDIYKDKSVENISRQENIEELLNAIHGFVEDRLEQGETSATLPNFLSEVSLLTDQDKETEDDRNKVTLMTVHASKGLEFKNVFVVGLEEQLFPSERSANSESELEEERRLFYVAITRAEEHCTISYARSRFHRGQTNYSNPSRFIKDIDERYLNNLEPGTSTTLSVKFSGLKDYQDSGDRDVTRHVSTTDFRKFVPVSSPRNSGVSNPPLSGELEGAHLTPGTRIRHERFGTGTIESINGEGDNTKIWVDFGNNERRQLLLKFARFTVL